MSFVAALCILAFAINVSRLWMNESPGNSQEPGRNWEQKSGNDGKFWKGTPDDSIYADMEGVRCYRYFEYSYDILGRLSTVKTFQPHDYYEDTWVMCNEESYEYDIQGRVTQRGKEDESEVWTYQYTKDGYTATCSTKNARDDTYVYDAEGKLIFSRIAGRYRYAHETSFEYDEKNRLIRENLEVESTSAYVARTIEYDDESHTSLETEYAYTGEVSYIWLNTYDEAWNKTGSVWCDTEKLPEGLSAEDCTAYYTKGYWVAYADGLLTEEITNKPWSDSANYSHYIAYNYDKNENCILELSIYDAESVYISRYVYDDQNRLIKQYEYKADEMRFWEEQQWDGNLLTVSNDGEGTLSVTRRAPDGTLVNQFVFGEREVKLQYTSAETIDWQISPAQMMAEKEQPDDVEEESSAPEKGFYYSVERGDTLWGIAEYYMGDGRQYQKIYEENQGIIGDDPGLILPGMKLYIDTE